MHYVVEFAKPFRMPDFFLISGLFLALVIDRDWRHLPRPQGRAFRLLLRAVAADPVRVQGAGPVAPRAASARSLRPICSRFIEPFGTLWFIYLLPIFFVVAKLARDVNPRSSRSGSRGALLEIAPIDTGWIVIDEFCARLVYFFAGWSGAADLRGRRMGAARIGGARARRPRRLGARQRRGGVRRRRGRPVVSLALGVAGAGGRHLRGADRGFGCGRAAALCGEHRSSSISPSSCRWRRRARRCSRPGSLRTSA